MRDRRVAVIGAGPAGLAAARELVRAGIEPRILERGSTLAHTWVNLYDSLVLHTGRHMSTLPGLSYRRGTSIFPTRDEFVSYLHRYATRFGLEVETETPVVRATPPSNGGPWSLQTPSGVIEADRVVMATGIVASPVVPTFPCQTSFAGRILHAVEYRRPEPFVGRRVLVVGVGNSGGEIAPELAASGARVAVSVRSGANVVPLTLLGLPIQYIAAVLWKLPRTIRMRVIGLVRTITERRRGPPVLPALGWENFDRIPLIGFHLDDAIRAGRIDVFPGVASFTERGVRFTDGSTREFDDVILATGYRAALQPLDGLVRTDARGFALRSDRVTSADLSGLYFIGHNYDVTGGLWNIRRDAPLIAECVQQG